MIPVAESAPVAVARHPLGHTYNQSSRSLSWRDQGGMPSFLDTSPGGQPYYHKRCQVHAPMCCPSHRTQNERAVWPHPSPLQLLKMKTGNQTRARVLIRHASARRAIYPVHKNNSSSSVRLLLGVHCQSSSSSSELHCACHMQVTSLDGVVAVLIDFNVLSRIEGQES